MGNNLFDDNSDSEIEKVQLNTNKDYAKSYNKLRQKELLKKLKDRDLDTSGSESSSESEYSEEEVVNNPKFDHEFLKTLSSLKKKDPKIYDKRTQFFADVEIEVASKSKDNDKKPFTLKDYERKVILEKGGQFEDDVDSEDDDEKTQFESLSYAEEQKRLKEEFRKVMNSDESDEEFGKIFKKRQTTKEEKETEEEQYLEWLAGKKENIAADAKETLNPLKQYWNKKDLPKPEQFLRDYILNNGYIDKDGDEIPTYDEIVGNEHLSEDEKELEKQAEFEQKFNFRFEEPDKDFIKRYPRTIENSVRKKDEKRKMKRDEVKDRKLKEKEEKYKEIEMLKALKKQEIEEKIQKLKEVTGNDQLPFQDDDLEEDFNPEEHDKRMGEIFNDDYYGVDEGDEKPECPDIEDLKTEDWDNFDPRKDDEDDECYNYEPHCEDEEFNMDCDYDPNSKQNFQDELIESTKDKRKRRKRRNRFMEMIKSEKPIFNPEDEKTYGQYIEEYYKMDCEDIVGDLPCRFKYVETVPNDFGLTIEEILLAKTKELNQWASLKKAVQFRSEHDEKRDVKMYKLKAKNEALKRKIFVSLYGPPSEDENEDFENKKSEDKNSISKVNETDKKKRENKIKKEEGTTGKRVNQYNLNDQPVSGDHVENPINLSNRRQYSVNPFKTEPQLREGKEKNIKTMNSGRQLSENLTNLSNRRQYSVNPFKTEPQLTEAQAVKLEGKEKEKKIIKTVKNKMVKDVKEINEESIKQYNDKLVSGDHFENLKNLSNRKQYSVNPFNREPQSKEIQTVKQQEKVKREKIITMNSGRQLSENLDKVGNEDLSQSVSNTAGKKKRKKKMVKEEKEINEESINQYNSNDKLVSGDHVENLKNLSNRKQYSVNPLNREPQSKEIQTVKQQEKEKKKKKKKNIKKLSLGPHLSESGVDHVVSEDLVLKSESKKDKGGKRKLTPSADKKHKKLDFKVALNEKLPRKKRKLSSTNVKSERVAPPIAQKRKTDGKMQKAVKKLKDKDSKSKKLKKKSSTDISDERLKAYGINPRKFHKKQKYLKFMKNKNHAKQSKAKTKQV